MLSEGQIAELKSKHGPDLVHVEDAGTDFVFRRPRKAEWARYVENLSSGDRKQTKVTTFARLCQDCLVYPEIETGKPDVGALNNFFDAKPGAPSNIAGELNDLAGAGDGLSVGKL